MEHTLQLRLAAEKAENEAADKAHATTQGGLADAQVPHVSK